MSDDTEDSPFGPVRKGLVGRKYEFFDQEPKDIDFVNDRHPDHNNVVSINRGKKIQSRKKAFRGKGY